MCYLLGHAGSEGEDEELTSEQLSDIVAHASSVLATHTSKVHITGQPCFDP